MARLFLAVWPPPNVLEALDELPRSEERGVRWTPRERLHATLRYVGKAEPADVVRALDGQPLRTARADVGPRVSRLGSRVVVAPVAGLDRLAADVGGATAELCEPGDPRSFTGHITLARMRTPGPCALVGHPVSGSFDVPYVALVASEQRTGSAKYTELARFPVEGGGA